MRRTRPKARTILDLLEEYEGQLTADFRRFYSLRLTDSVLTTDYDEVINLIQWLPAESAFVVSAQCKGDTKLARGLIGWSTTDDLILTLMNMTNYQTYVISASAGNKRAKPPTEIKNPRVQSQKPRRGSGGDASDFARALLAQQKG